LIKSTEFSVLATPLFDTAQKRPEEREKNEQLLFGLAEQKDSSPFGKDEKREKKEASILKYRMLLLSIRSTFQSVLDALLHFESSRSQEEIAGQLPDFYERVDYLKTHIAECNRLLKQLT
jgi:hypothetical protein